MCRGIKNVISTSIVIATVLFVGACGGHETNDRTNGISAKGDNTRLSCGEATLYAKTHDGCDAMEVSGEGACFCLLGYYWDGQQCTDLSGACECVGSDCGRLSQSLEECEAQHSTCDAPMQQQRPSPQQRPTAQQPLPQQRLSCGDEALFAQQHDSCDAMNISGEGACFCHLGFYWDGQQCTALNGVCECVGPDCDRLSQSLEDCQAQHSTCSAPEPPPEQHISCGDEALFAQQHDGCDAMNVSGEGACFCLLGYYWDGQQCTDLSGACECVGPDCDRLSQSLEDCQAQHATCS